MRLAAAAACALVSAACAPGGFRAACLSIQRGELVNGAASRLEHSGGEYLGKSGQAYSWRAGWVKVASCVVEDDQPAEPETANRFKRPRVDARVVEVRYVEGRSGP